MEKFPHNKRVAEDACRAAVIAGRRRWRAAHAGLFVLALSAALADVAPTAAQERELPEPLVHLRDVDASILQDIRYAGADNFTGRRVPGYTAAECVLLREVAEALSRVQKDLLPHELSLKVYDCYRPRRAVRAFVAWVRASDSTPSLKRFYPNVDRSQLIALGYLAGVSRHSRGDTVDLTLVRLPVRQAPAFNRSATYGSCTGPTEGRSPDNGVDMGTSFDCLDPLSHTGAPGLTAGQRRWRQTLVEAMARQGFRNYHKEWWHFTFMLARRGPAFDFPIPPRKP